MSSILKALKKLENDKATRRPDELKIDAEILRTGRTRHFSATGILLTSLLLLAGGSGATYLYMKQELFSERAKQNVSILSRQNLTDGSASSNIQAEAPPEPLVVVPAQQHKTAGVASEVPSQLLQSSEPVRANIQQIKVGHLVPSKRVDSAKKTPSIPAQPLSAVVKSVPALRVNGIAFQDKSADSVAMVNGVAVTNGSIIEGVKIEEINKNKVIFSFNGEKFDIQLGQSNQ